MKKFKRIILLVLDGVGVGTFTKESEYTSTIEDVLKRVRELKLSNLLNHGIQELINIDKYQKKSTYISHYGKIRISSRFADSWAGHWELAGVPLSEDYSTYWKGGFNKNIIDLFIKETGYSVIGNQSFFRRDDVLPTYLREHINNPNSVIVLTEEGLESIRTFGIYALVDNIPLEKQYALCEKAKEILAPYNNIIGRIGSRPLVFQNDQICVPHDKRKDYLIFNPPRDTLLKSLRGEGINTYAAGKVWAMFRGEGIERSTYTRTNNESIQALHTFMEEVSEGLIFVNLNDFDARYGHYFDLEGWSKAFEEFDKQMYEIQENMNEDDLLIICSDGHGCDPVYSGLHTREYSPLLVYHQRVEKGKNLGVTKKLCDISATIAENFEIDYKLSGDSFFREVL